MANSNYAINLSNTSGSNYYAVAIKDPTKATAASTGTFLPIPKYHSTVNQLDPAVTITAATNATPIVCTATNTLSDGDVVYVFGGLVNTGINGTFEVTSSSGSGFTLLGSRGTGTYTASSAKFVKVEKTPSLSAALSAAVAAILNDRASNG